MKSYLKKLRDGVIILATAFVILLVLEIAVRVFTPQTSHIHYLNDKPIAIADEELGHVLRPNSRQEVSTDEYQAVYGINEQGLRDSQVYGPQKKGGVRALLIGDSFAFGHGVDYEETWGYLAEKKIQESGEPFEIIKAGVPGYDTAQETVFLERIFPKFNPDLVVLVFLPNDLFGIKSLSSLHSAAGVAAAGTVVSIRNKKTGYQTLLFLQKLLMQNDFLYQWVCEHSGRDRFFETRPIPEVEGAYSNVEAWLIRARDFCAKRNARLVVFSIPQLYQVIVGQQQSQTGRLDIRKADERLGAFAAKAGIPWISALPYMESRYGEERELYYRFDGHLTKQGNKAIADFFSAQIGPLAVQADLGDGSGGDTLS